MCFIKSILWGFNFEVGGHGGAVYLSNGVPDVGANKLIDLCYDISYDFKNILVGEVLWLDGHVGIYIGDGNVAEATLAWDEKVVISKVGDDGSRTRKGVKVYNWVKHGKLPYINYNNPYVTISLNIEEVGFDYVIISYTNDLEIDEVLYSFDDVNFYKLEDSKIDNLIPNTEYNLTLKARRKYTSNYTSVTKSFKTKDNTIPQANNIEIKKILSKIVMIISSLLLVFELIKSIL